MAWSGWGKIMDYDYLIVTRELGSDNQFTADVGPVCFVRVPRDEPLYDGSHVIDRGSWIKEVQATADYSPNPHSISPTGDVLVFVHGYNNLIGNVLARMRCLRANMQKQQWRGTIVSFDWPSDDQTLAYLQDRDNAADVADKLVTDCLSLLVVNQRSGCETNVHLLGHSTGAYVIMEAFSVAQKKGEFFKSDWRIGQVAFISGDVSRSSLNNGSDWCQPMFDRIMRFTNYANPFDSVLAVSNAKRLGTAPRAGRVGLPDQAPEKAVNVNCGDVFERLDPRTYPNAVGNWTHSWQFLSDTFALDLALSLEGAIDRNALPTRQLKNGTLFLQDGERPSYQSAVNIKAELNQARPGT